MDLFEQALAFAAQRHRGQFRKYQDIPYIIHPIEVASIAATLTTDPEILAAAVLHDTVEDTDTNPQEIAERFGARVAGLVTSETELPQGSSPEQTWVLRKKHSLQELAEAKDPAVKILWLSDKLSNIRSFSRQYDAEGAAVWSGFHQRDPAMQAWYYRSIAEYTKEFSDTAAHREYRYHLQKLFQDVEEIKL